MSLLRSLSTRTADAPQEATEARSSFGVDFAAIVRQAMSGAGGAAASLGSSSDPAVAMTHPTVYRSVSKISGIVAQMPWDSFRGTAEVRPQPSLLASPSPGALRPAVWKRTAATSMLLAGGAYALVVESRGGLRLNLLNPKRIDWSVGEGWMLDDEPVEEWPLGPLWQVPYQTMPGSPKGVNPLEFARRTTYAGLAANEFGSNFFRDGGHPTAIIATESDPGPDGAKALKERVRRATAGTNREPLVLPQSVTWTPLQVSPEDSQFIELMKFSGAELAGFFGLMPEHVGLPVEGSGIQYSNRENRQQDLLQDAIMPVLLPLEEGLSDLVPNGQRVKFNVAGLLRGDLNSRYNSYESAARIEQMIGEPLLTINEMRELEDREPHVDGADSAVEGASARELSEIVQKIYQGVGVVVTADEAREVLNKAGGNLPPGFTPDPTETTDEAE